MTGYLNFEYGNECGITQDFKLLKEPLVSLYTSYTMKLTKTITTMNISCNILL